MYIPDTEEGWMSLHCFIKMKRAMLLYEKTKMYNILPSYIWMGRVKNVHCLYVYSGVYICLYIKEKKRRP